MTAGGNDAGQQIIAPYREFAARFPVLPYDVEVLPDGTVEAAFHGFNAQGWPRFECQDQVPLDLKKARHESAHALEEKLERLLAVVKGWTFEQARDYVRTGFWQVRFGPPPFAAAVRATWQQALAEANAHIAANEQENGWKRNPGELWAEDFKCVMYGYKIEEKAFDDGVMLTAGRIEALGQFVEEMMEEAGEEVAKTIEFSMDLVNGNATRIGTNPTTGAFPLTEAERVALGLVSGRTYSAQMKRIWLAGTESTFPDVLGSVYEDTTVALGATGRWKFLAAARRDVGGSGRYELAISTVTAKVVR